LTDVGELFSKSWLEDMDDRTILLPYDTAFIGGATADLALDVVKLSDVSKRLRGDRRGA